MNYDRSALLHVKVKVDGLRGRSLLGTECLVDLLEPDADVLHHVWKADQVRCSSIVAQYELCLGGDRIVERGGSAVQPLDDRHPLDFNEMGVHQCVQDV